MQKSASSSCEAWAILTDWSGPHWRSMDALPRTDVVVDCHRPHSPSFPKGTVTTKQLRPPGRCKRDGRVAINPSARTQLLLLFVGDDVDFYASVHGPARLGVITGNGVRRSHALGGQTRSAHAVGH